MLSIYTIRLCHKYTKRFPYYMFLTDGAIFRYIGVYTYNLLLPSATLPTLASVHTLGVPGMYGLCLPFFCEIYCLWDIYNIKVLNTKVGPGYQPGCIILRVGNLAD
jgi:hypothetical protein